jgi:hypothetical protein
MRLYQKGLFFIFLNVLLWSVAVVLFLIFIDWFDVARLLIFVCFVVPLGWVFASRFVSFNRWCPNCSEDLLFQKRTEIKTDSKWIKFGGMKVLKVDSIVFPFCLNCPFCGIEL